MFIKRPDVVIFDEATSAMDPRLEEVFLNELEEKLGCKDRIFIFISHRLSPIKRCDEIVLMGKKAIQFIYKSYDKAVLDERFIKLYKSQLK